MSRIVRTINVPNWLNFNAIVLEEDGMLQVILKNRSGNVIHTDTYKLVDSITRMTDCYCCTCSDYGAADPFCRNHGFYGKRPCDIHGMPGSPIEDTGKMPDPVSVERKRLEQE